MNLSFLLLTWLSVAFQATAADTVTNPESRKLLQHRIDPGLLDEVASDFSKTELPTLESFLRRKGEKASPPSPPSPARSEMCMGIPFKRYRFVKSMGEIRNALSQVCSNLPSPPVFSAHTRVSHVHSSSLSRHRSPAFALTLTGHDRAGQAGRSHRGQVGGLLPGPGPR